MEDVAPRSGWHTVARVIEAAFELPTDEGFVIRGHVEVPSRPGGGTIVCVHGFKGFKDWGFWPEVTRRFRERSFAVVRFNFSHSGIGPDGETFSEQRSFETGTYSREVEDLRLVLGALADRNLPGGDSIDASRVALLGHSRGSVSALAVGAERIRSIASIALWNPASSVLWWDEEERRRWRERGYWEVVNSRTGQIFRMSTALLDDAEGGQKRLDPIENARRLAVPLLVVVAMEDESVPPDSGRRLARAAPQGLASLHEIPGTGHTFGAAHPPRGATPALEDAIAATLAHFERTLGSRAA